jgi:hypothetical protein
LDTSVASENRRGDEGKFVGELGQAPGTAGVVGEVGSTRAAERVDTGHVIRDKPVQATHQARLCGVPRSEAEWVEAPVHSYSGQPLMDGG